MVLQLHVWAPAFGLPSLDAECLAAIAYLAQTASPADYRLIQSSPSAVPTQQLPALHDPATSTWTSGFSAISTRLQTCPPPSFQDPSLPVSSSSSSSSSSASSSKPTAPGPPQAATPPPSGPTPGLSPAPASAAADSVGDAAAYAAFLTARAAPLLALSLYASHANYAGATRPAYSAGLPFPLPWTEPPAARAQMARRAEQLGFSDLDADAGAGLGLGADADADGGGGGGLGGGLGRRGGGGEVEREVDGGWVRVPKGLGYGGTKRKTVVGSLSAEQKARIRLEAAAADVLDVLADADWLETGASGKGLTVAARCLAFGYLALMAVPDLPRPWLREVMQRRYAGLCEFVRRFRAEVLPEGRALPWADRPAGSSAVELAGRFARGVLGEVPIIGEQWTRWWTAKQKRQTLGRKGLQPEPSSGDMVLALGAGLGLAAVSAGVFLYRALPPFGEAVQVWRKPVATLSSFGAAGAMFSGALYGVD